MPPSRKHLVFSFAKKWEGEKKMVSKWFKSSKDSEVSKDINSVAVEYLNTASGDNPWRIFWCMVSPGAQHSINGTPWSFATWGLAQKDEFMSFTWNKSSLQPKFPLSEANLVVCLSWLCILAWKIKVALWILLGKKEWGLAGVQRDLGSWPSDWGSVWNALTKPLGSMSSVTIATLGPLLQILAVSANQLRPWAIKSIYDKARCYILKDAQTKHKGARGREEVKFSLKVIFLHHTIEIINGNRKQLFYVKRELIQQILTPIAN